LLHSAICHRVHLAIEMARRAVERMKLCDLCRLEVIYNTPTTCTATRWRPHDLPSVAFHVAPSLPVASGHVPAQLQNERLAYGLRPGCSRRSGCNLCTVVPRSSSQRSVCYCTKAHASFNSSGVNCRWKLQCCSLLSFQRQAQVGHNDQ